jgi:predicted aspartyl protease
MRRWMITVILICFFSPEAGFSDIYYWVDDQGIQNYTARLESVPEEYRSKAQQLSLPPTPPAPPELKPSPPTNGLTRIPFFPGSPVLVKAKINGLEPITLILDTGAERTMISPTVQSRLGLSSENAPPVILKGVTGMGYANSVWVDFIEVGETRVGPLLVIVYAADLKEADGLLGRDFLSRLNVTIDSKEKVITLTPN